MVPHVNCGLPRRLGPSFQESAPPIKRGRSARGYRARIRLRLRVLQCPPRKWPRCFFPDYVHNALIWHLAVCVWPRQNLDDAVRRNGHYLGRSVYELNPRYGAIESEAFPLNIWTPFSFERKGSLLTAATLDRGLKYTPDSRKKARVNPCCSPNGWIGSIGPRPPVESQTEPLPELGRRLPDTGTIHSNRL
jgi:hypothetical protein